MRISSCDARRSVSPAQDHAGAGKLRFLAQDRQVGEVGPQIRPSFRRIDDRGRDDAIVVVEFAVAGVAHDAPGDRLQGDQRLVLGPMAQQPRGDRRAPLRLAGGQGDLAEDGGDLGDVGRDRVGPFGVGERDRHPLRILTVAPDRRPRGG